jgi:hypothetical protein
MLLWVSEMDHDLLAVNFELLDEPQTLVEDIHCLVEDLASGQPYFESRDRLRQRKAPSGYGLARQHNQELSTHL